MPSRSRTRSRTRSPRRSPARSSPRGGRSPRRSRSPIARGSPRRSVGMDSPRGRSPARGSPARRSPVRGSPRRSPARGSPARRSPVRGSPRRSPVRRSRTPRSRSRSNDRRGGRGRDHSRSPMSSRRRHVGNRDNPEASKCVGVFGLSLYTTERELEKEFGKYGPLEKVQVVLDGHSGRSRGFAFLYFESKNDACAAREALNGMDLDGRKIRVDFSITKRAHTPTPGMYMGRPTASRDGARDRYSRDMDRRKRDRSRERGGRRGRSPSPYRRRRSRSRSFSPRRERY